jgi:hypothetical protein
MAKSRPQAKTIEFEHRVKVVARPAKFLPSNNLAYLDLEKLSRASKAEFEVGHIKEGKTSRAVLAVVKKGMVVGLHLEDCPSCKSLDMAPELRSLFDEARRRLGLYNPSHFKPIPVREFLGRPIGPHCFVICIYGYCLTCCYCCTSGPEGEIIFAGCMISKGLPYPVP